MAKTISYSKIVLLATALLSVCNLYAQNLVPNPGFEQIGICPPSPAFSYCQSWTIPANHTGSPDYFHACASGMGGVPVNLMGYQWPASGNAYVGFFIKIAGAQYREYMQAQLTAPLTAGAVYSISLKCALANAPAQNASIMTDALGMYISQNPLVYSGGGPGPIPVIPQFNSPVTLDTVTWAEVGFYYIASGGEQYLTLGNFKNDANTFMVPAQQTAYVLVDDVSVEIETGLIITGDTLICASSSTTLTAYNGASYAWANASAPGNILFNGPSFTVSPAVTTTYYVYAPTDTDTVTVHVYPPLAVNAGPDVTVCPQQTVTLSGSGAAAYSWNNGISNGVPFTPTAPATAYILTGTDTNGCSASDTVLVTLNPNPSVNLGPDAVLCTGQTLTLNAATPGATYQWQDHSTAATYTVHQGGTYSVTVNLAGCTAGDQIVITEHPMPVVNLGNDATLCSGTPLTLDATTAGAAYLWQNNAATPTLSPTSSGLYWVQVTVNGCSDRDSIQITFLPLPAVQLGNDTMPCVGSTILLDATGPGLSYSWQDDSNLPTYTVSQSGTYSVQVTDGNGCHNSDAVTVTFITAPQFSFADTVLCKGDVWVLDVTAPAAVYLWQDKSAQPVYSVYSEGRYWATVTNPCGSASDTTNVESRRCDCFLYIPDSFTPNRDLLNEKFLVTHNTECSLEHYTFSVFNRWGQLIFETGNIEFLWDGTQNGKILPMDVYVYRVEYKFDKSPLSRQWGHVSLMR